MGETASSGAGPNSGALGSIFDSAVDPANLTDFGEGSGIVASGTDAGNGGTESGEVKYNKDGSVRKRRGRQPGSGSGSSGSGGTTKKTASIDLDGLTQILLSMHGMLAMIVQEESFLLNDAEAKSLAKALEGVASHYDVGASSKTIAWTNLAMVAGSIYSSRAIAVYVKGKRKVARDASFHMAE